MALIEFDIYNQKKIPFNYYLTTKDVRVIRLADKIMGMLELGNKKIEQKREFLITFLLNMKIAKESHKYITISRDQNNYLGPERYKKPNRSYRLTISVLNKLKEMNFIDHIRGVKFKGKPGLQTKIVPKPVLTALMSFVDYSVIDLARPNEFIVLRNDKEVKIDYTDSRNTITLRNDLIKYNELRESTKLELRNIEWEVYKKYKDRIVIFIKDKLNKTEKGKPVSFSIRKSYMHRSFKIAFVLGGRYYGGIETWMKRELRKYICINGRKTVELDYSGLHLRILYNMDRLECPADPYVIMKNQSETLRDIYKLTSLIMLNAFSKEEAVSAIRGQLKGSEYKKAIPNLKDPTLNKLCDDFVNAHPAMKKHFYSGVGLKLQYQDSKVAEMIINYFTEKGILVLAIHDSFIIERRYRDELFEKMVEFYEKRFKYKPVIKEK